METNNFLEGNEEEKFGVSSNSEIIQGNNNNKTGNSKKRKLDDVKKPKNEKEPIKIFQQIQIQFKIITTL